MKDAPNNINTVKKSTVMIYDHDSYIGSGAIISANGFIITCNHVIFNASKLFVKVGSRKKPAYIYKQNFENDLAILKIEGNFTVHITPQIIGEIQQGQTIYCFGYPLARDQKMRDVNVIKGIISVLHKNKDGQIISIQISAPITNGFSGGPVLDGTSGHVIGIIATKLTKHPKYKDEIIKDVGFCFPIDNIYFLLSDFELNHAKINWSQYANKLIDKYKHGDEFYNYIDLQCQNNKGKKYDLMSYIFNNWLPDKKKELLSILGDYGSGKSFFCHRIAFKMADDYLNRNKDVKIPIILNLKDYNEYDNIRDFFSDKIATALGLQDLSWEQLEVILSNGKILLIFDGFDEMDMKANKLQIIENFNIISNILLPEIKVILTCRIHYFGSEHEENYVLAKTRKPDYFEDLVSLSNRPEQTAIIYLEDLTDTNVQMYLQNTLGEGWKNVYDKINNPEFYDLNDLSKRPIFLSIIVEDFPNYKFTKERITGTRLYQKYLDACITRESKKSGFFAEEGLKFIEELAFESYARGRSYITDEVLKGVCSKLNIRQQKLQQFLRKCPFLKRSSETSGKFGFMNQSFFEFFIANKLARDIQIRNHTSYATEYLTPQIDKYLFELLKIADNINIITSWLEKHPDVNVRMNCASSIGRSGQKSFIPLLEKCLEKEKDIGVAGRISEALVHLGIKDSVDKFLSNLEKYGQLKQETGKSDDHKLLYDIVDQLQITNFEVINILIENLSHHNARIRKYAAFILGRIPNNNSVPGLIKLLTDIKEPIRTRRYAAAALGLIGDIQAEPHLRDVSVKCNNRYLTQECVKAITRINKNPYHNLKPEI